MCGAAPAVVGFDVVGVARLTAALFLRWRAMGDDGFDLFPVGDEGEASTGSPVAANVDVVLSVVAPNRLLLLFEMY